MTLRSPTSLAAVQTAACEQEVLNALAYFDVFDHPLTLEELHRHLSDRALTLPQLVNLVDSLVQRRHILRANPFVTISEHPDGIAERRRLREKRACRLIRRARLVAALLKRVPFVRAVFLTGSLSKGVAPPDSDVDFMIVTETGRLWICRLIITALKKALFLNSKKYFCVNLVVSDSNLTMASRTFYDAVEVQTVFPLCNLSMFVRFVEANRWVGAILPHGRPMRFPVPLLAEERAGSQRMVEAVLSLLPLRSADERLLDLARRRWRSRYAALSEDEFERRVQCRRDISAVWPADARTAILEAAAYRIRRFRIGEAA